MSYGTAGVASITVPGSLDVSINDVAARSNDATVVVGDETPMSGSAKFVIAKFRANGEPDLTFSDDGVTRIGFPQGDAYGYGVAIQPDGKIVVVGEVDPNMTASNPAILRLNANGSLDKSVRRPRPQGGQAAGRRQGLRRRLARRDPVGREDRDGGVAGSREQQLQDPRDAIEAGRRAGQDVRRRRHRHHRRRRYETGRTGLPRTATSSSSGSTSPRTLPGSCG